LVTLREIAVELAAASYSGPRSGGFQVVSCEWCSSGVAKPLAKQPKTTDDMITVRALMEKSPDADFLGEMIDFAAQRLMEPEVQAKTGAAWGEKSSERLAQRRYHDVPSGPVGRLGRWTWSRC
jgi:hypothetical protein